MHIEFLVEELSAKVALDNILSKILEKNATFQIHDHQGKQDLLKKLEAKLRAYKEWIPDEFRIVVLVDEDRQDCHKLKKELETVAAGVGFVTKTTAGPGASFQVLNRLAIEELEAWYFGDMEAVAAAYPRFSADLVDKAKYRDPDAIKGGTCEALARELYRVGYHREGLAKVKAARDISPHMIPDRNRSKSFRIFVEGVKAMLLRPKRVFGTDNDKRII